VKEDSLNDLSSRVCGVFDVHTYVFILFSHGNVCCIIIICDIYIAPYSARSCPRALYNIIYNVIILIQTCFHPAHMSTPNGAYNACCRYRGKALLKHIAITSCQMLIFLWMSEPVTAWQHCSSPSLERSATSPTL